ncbi:Epoxide hydrolase 2 [Melia azedarach]|uniref:Epoxide hydrolase 2 n=1 Tax=Melia azedarach TaxID=155640 RepID=A0ACC1XSH8_MELAZ|nr:Epoxide hydrolase 2 [Melia azedarach]
MSKLKAVKSEVSFHRIRTEGICIHAAEQGMGPLVVLFHGFPEFCFRPDGVKEFVSLFIEEIQILEILNFIEASSEMDITSVSFRNQEGLRGHLQGMTV